MKTVSKYQQAKQILKNIANEYKEIFKYDKPAQRQNMKPSKLYSKQYDSYCTWNGTAYENDGKVPGAYFYGLEKAKNNGFEPVEENSKI